MDVGGLRLHCGDLALSLSALLELGHLLTLHRRCCNFLSKNDITNLTRGQRRNIDAVPLAEVLQGASSDDSRACTNVETHRKNEILESHLDLDPFLITQRRPNEVRLRDGVLVWTQNDLRLLLVDVQPTK